MARPTASSTSTSNVQQPPIASQQHHLPQQQQAAYLGTTAPTSATYYSHAPTYHAYPAYPTYPVSASTAPAPAPASGGLSNLGKEKNTSKSAARSRKASLNYPQYEPGLGMGMGMMGMASASTPALAMPQQQAQAQGSSSSSSSGPKRFGFRPWARRGNSLDVGGGGATTGSGNSNRPSPAAAFTSSAQQQQQQQQYAYGVQGTTYPGGIPNYMYWNPYPSQPIIPRQITYDPTGHSIANMAGVGAGAQGQGQRGPHGDHDPHAPDLRGNTTSDDPDPMTSDDSPSSPDVNVNANRHRDRDRDHHPVAVGKNNSTGSTSQRGLGGHQRKTSEVPTVVISPASPPPTSSDLHDPSSSSQHPSGPSGIIGSDLGQGQGYPSSSSTEPTSTIAGVTYPKSPQPSIKRQFHSGAASNEMDDNNGADPSPAIIPLPMSPSVQGGDGSSMASPRHVPLPFSPPPGAGPSSLGSPSLGGVNRQPSRMSMRRATSPLSSSSHFPPPPSSSQRAAGVDHVEQIGIIPAGINVDMGATDARASGEGVAGGGGHTGAMPSFGGMVNSMGLSSGGGGGPGSNTGTGPGTRGNRQGQGQGQAPGYGHDEDDAPPRVVPMVFSEDFDQQESHSHSHSHGAAAPISASASASGMEGTGRPSRSSNTRSPEARGPHAASAHMHAQQAQSSRPGQGGRMPMQRPGAGRRGYTLPYAPAPNAPGVGKWTYLPPSSEPNAHASAATMTTGPPSRSNGPGAGVGPAAGPGGVSMMMRPQTSRQPTNSSGSPLIDLKTPTDEYPPHPSLTSTGGAPAPAPIPVPTAASVAAAAAGGGGGARGAGTGRSWGDRFRPGASRIRRGKRPPVTGGGIEPHVGAEAYPEAYADPDQDPDADAVPVIPSNVVDLTGGGAGMMGSPPSSSATATPTPQHPIPNPTRTRTRDPSPRLFTRLRRPSTATAPPPPSSGMMGMGPSMLSPTTATGPSPMTAKNLAQQHQQQQQQQQQQWKPSFVSRLRLRRKLPPVHPILTTEAQERQTLGIIPNGVDVDVDADVGGGPSPVDERRPEGERGEQDWERGGGYGRERERERRGEYERERGEEYEQRERGGEYERERERGGEYEQRERGGEYEPRERKRSTPTRANYHHHHRTTPTTTTPTAATAATAPIIPQDVATTGAGATTSADEDNRPPSLTPSDATLSTATIHTPTSSRGFQFSISPPTSYGKKAGAAVVAEANVKPNAQLPTRERERDRERGGEEFQQYPQPFVEKPRRGRSGSASGLATSRGGASGRGKGGERSPEGANNGGGFYRGFPNLSLGRNTKRIMNITFSDDASDPYFTFSNRAPKSVFYRKRLFPTAEHLFQAMRFMSPPTFRAFHQHLGGGQGATEREHIVEEIRACPTVDEALAVARAYEHYQRKDWQSVQLNKVRPSHLVLSIEVIESHTPFDM